MKSRKLKMILATTVITAVAVTGLVITKAGGTTTKPSTHHAGGDGYCADLDETIGLYVGNPVTQMGMKVGEISAVTLRGDHVQVEFSLNDGRAYPADVQAVTRSKSLLADRSLELVGNYRSGEMLTPGECINTERTHTPKSISEIAGSASDFIEAITDADSGDVESALDGLDAALVGVGPAANTMFQQAASASRNPDQFIADIGSSVANMAPLNESALQRWPQIMSIVNQMPEVTWRGDDLLGPAGDFCRGVGWIVATIYDIQRNYGDEYIWPTMRGPVKDIIALAAARSPDLQSLYGMVPSVAAGMRAQANLTGGLSIPYKAPTVRTSRGGTVDLLSMILGKASQ
ncbi:MCE family protein [Gordonia jinghuaiqii]|uniref:MCE family protein n=1 Tax=Gordonia jinghuaiqii TaxID=2758710 RepID=A0A7D7R4H3_9ACTN|nr:MlaD family protein [Gordonia jinghuaiqii]MCR5978390.1 MCE family protein [Gordonia jinghuaiqii]QMT02732.1 MCE family protein [Gordonia jinghuaiqii]